MATITEQDREALRREWTDLGRMVLADDPDSADHPVLYAWILAFIDGGINDPDYEAIYVLIYHSVNFDIPFRATERVRGELISFVRRKLTPRGVPAPGDP